MPKEKNVPLVALIAVAVLAVLWLVGKSSVPGSGADDGTATEHGATESKFAGKTVVWIDSYHQGYAWSDGIEHGIVRMFAKSGITLVALRLDAKRNSDDATCTRNAARIKARIDELKPDLIIASDDHAQKYLVVPYYRDGNIPVIFCGVNWSAKEYGYPTANVTGMIEVDLVLPLIDHLRRYSKGPSIAYVATDDLTERKLSAEQNSRFFGGKMKVYLAPEKTFQSFTETFLRAQKETDMILLSNNAGIADWDDAKAELFFRENTEKPTGGINSWMAGYALITFYKLPEEQGEWAAKAAMKVLSGVPVSEIPVATNKEGSLILNMDIAEKLDIVFSLDLLRNAETHQSVFK